MSVLGGWDDDRPVRFQQAGETKSFGESLFSYDADQSVLTEEGRKRYGDTIDAASRQTRYTGLINSRDKVRADAVDGYIERVQRLTGQKLENPLTGGYWKEAGAIPQYMSGDDWRRIWGIFDDKVRTIARDPANREIANDLQFNLHNEARGLVLKAETDAARAAEKPLSEVGRFGAQVAGGIAGSALSADPLFYGGMAAGPAGAAGRTALGRIGNAALTQGAFNAGLSALAQPSVQQWRREMGLRSGAEPAIEEVGFAFLMGAIPGAAIQGGGEVMRALRPQLRRVMDGTASPAEVRQVLEIVNPQGAADDGRVIAQVQAAQDAARISEAERPAGVAPADHDAALTQTLRAAQDNTLPPPEMPVRLPDEPPGRATLNDRAPLLPAGAGVVVDGKTASFGRFDAAALDTDAAAFQYKGGGDAAGVTDRLRGVDRWDPIAASRAMVFERGDGGLVIADGHQRLGLARRLLAEGKENAIGLDGVLFREADGWTPADVRALAARKNMQEGSGTPLDAARMLRDRPDLLDAGVPVTSPAMKQAVGLSRLSDEAFGMTINGAVPENYAAAVGALAPDAGTHAALIADLARARPATEREARFLIGDALAAGFRMEEQIDLFGAGSVTRSLLAERAAVMGTALRLLADDAKLFGTLASRADVIEAAGNALDRAGNAGKAESAAIVGELVQRLAQRTGPVSDRLNAMAARVASHDMKPKAAARQFLNEVKQDLDERGLAALMAQPRLAPSKVVEPGTPEALAAVDDMTADLFGGSPEKPPAASAGDPAGMPAPPEPRPLGKVDLLDAIDTDAQGKAVSLQSALDEADRIGFHADLVKSCKVSD